MSTDSQYCVTGADETLSNYLWTETDQLHQDALNSSFVQGIKNASLDPTAFDMFKEWHIEDTANVIKLGDACANYVKHLDAVANNFEPVYLVAAIIPCVRLWPWIGEQIGVQHSNSDKFGVYTKFAKTNFDPNYKGYERYELLINNAYKEGTIEKENALKVYQKSMNGEVDFFNSV